jgi:NADH-quinone oxidoreductase subunit N
MLISAGFFVLILDLFTSKKRILGWVVLTAACIAPFFVSFVESPLGLFSGLFILDSFSIFFKLAVFLILAVTVLLTFAYSGISNKQEGELYALLAFIGVGLIMMASSSNLLMIFLSIEFVSITSYILTGLRKQDQLSSEAALKYLLFGSAASACMLYGMSLLYGLSGTLELSGLNQTIQIGAASVSVLLIAFSLVLAGFLFKISAAPFHMWAPDVYTGAPTPIAAFLTVAPKALGFAVLIRFLTVLFDAFETNHIILLGALSALTMTIGNLSAISQNNIKRLLAYSSIAQAGYILMGVAASNTIGLAGVLFYLAAYILTNLGAFTIVIILGGNVKNYEISSYAGLSSRSPFLALALTIFFISLAGIPPVAGFVGKFLLFAGVLDKGLIILAVIAAINSAIAVYYYFRVVKIMYLQEPASTAPIQKPLSGLAAIGITLAAILILGILPAQLLEFVKLSLF